MSVAYRVSHFLLRSAHSTMHDLIYHPQASGFHINYLSKVPEVKDTVHKHSLLHHLCVTIHELHPDSGDLYAEISAIARCAKVNLKSICLLRRTTS